MGGSRPLAGTWQHLKSLVQNQEAERRGGQGGGLLQRGRHSWRAERTRPGPLGFLALLPWGLLKIQARDPSCLVSDCPYSNAALLSVPLAWLMLTTFPWPRKCCHPNFANRDPVAERGGDLLLVAQQAGAGNGAQTPWPPYRAAPGGGGRRCATLPLRSPAADRRETTPAPPSPSFWAPCPVCAAVYFKAPRGLQAWTPRHSL